MINIQKLYVLHDSLHIGCALLKLYSCFSVIQLGHQTTERGYRSKNMPTLRH